MDKKKSDKFIILATEDDDKDAEKLMSEEGIVCYTRDLVPFSILRGLLDLESDEFKIKVRANDVGATKKTRGRKS